MSRAFVMELCARLPGAEWSEPFGPGTDVWKVGGKIFAAMGERAEGVSVKCADVETAEMLREVGVARKAPYFHKYWVMLPFAAGEGELDHRLRASYALIRASLPKRVQAALDPLP